MHVAVLGSTGMAGSMISHYLKIKGHTVTRFARTIESDYMDVCFHAHNQYNLNDFNNYITFKHPDVIINCIGYLVRMSNKNPAEAVYLNSYFPHLLENLTRGTNTKVIHLSTDCIFAGLNIHGYNEVALPTERNYYGRSKALGELNNEKDLTLRQSIIGPAPQASNNGFLNWILTEVSPEVSGWSNVLWNGITTLELAKQIEYIITKSPELSGIVNLVPPEIVSKETLIRLIVKEWKSPLKVKGVISELASNKILKSTRKDSPVVESDYREQLKELHKYMDKHNIKVGTLNVKEL